MRFTRFLSTFLALALFAHSLPAAERAATPDAAWYSARISVDLGNGSRGTGSGTPIAAGDGTTLILTNAHVVESDAHAITVTIGGKTHVGTYLGGSGVTHPAPGVIALDGPDLAVVSIPVEVDVVPVAESLPARGASVWQRGYGGAVGDPIHRAGTVTGNAFVNPTLSSTILSVSGDSGAGVFDEAGHLVAVTWGGTPGVCSCAVPMPTVKRFLLRDRLRALFPRLGARRTLPPPKAGMPSAPVPIPKAIPTPMPPPKTPAPAPMVVPAPATVLPPPVRLQMVPHVESRGVFGRRQVTTWSWEPVGSVGGGCSNGRCPLPR